MKGDALNPKVTPLTDEEKAANVAKAVQPLAEMGKKSRKARSPSKMMFLPAIFLEGDKMGSIVKKMGSTVKSLEAYAKSQSEAVPDGKYVIVTIRKTLVVGTTQLLPVRTVKTVN